MREYELTVVIQPDIDEQRRNETVEWLSGQLSTAGANTEEMTADHWGQRALAYPIEDHTSGYYVHYVVGLDPTKTREMERNMKFREELLRFLLVRKED